MIPLTFTCVSLIASGHTILFAAAAGWYSTNSALVWTDRPKFDRREANPPWYVRYTDRVKTVIVQTWKRLKGLVRS